jgi:hypothetical protein
LSVESPFFKALAKAYAEIGNPKKDSTNPHFRNKYASLEEVISVVRPVLAANGFTLLQHPGAISLAQPVATMDLHTTLIHTSGERMDWEMSIPLSKVDPQQMGSAITYARRYSLLALFCLAAEDDDAEEAMGRIAGGSPF